MYGIPMENTPGGVGLCWKDNLSKFMFNDREFTKTCDCTKCEIESLVVDITHRGADHTFPLSTLKYSNESHFTNDLERLVADFDKKENWILTGDISMGLMYYNPNNVKNYITALMS